jgi:lysophospholipase L1-like esterase
MRVFCGLFLAVLLLVSGVPTAHAQTLFNSDRLDQRDPAVSDDGSAGYAAGDLWINHKDHKAWKLADGTKGAAKWQELPWPTARLADAVTSVPCALGVGTRQLKSGYAGDLIAMTRDKDRAMNSFGGKDGAINSAAIDTWLGSEPGLVTKLFDQCGDHNLTALSDRNRAGYGFDKEKQQASVIFDGMNHMGDQKNSPLFQNAGGPRFAMNNLSVFMVGTAQGAALDAVLLDFDPLSHAFLIGSQVGGRTFLKPAPSGGSNFGQAFESVPGVMGVTSGKAVKTIFNNKTQTVAGTYPGATVNGLNFGGTDAVMTYPASIDLMALVVFSGEVTAEETQNLMLSASAQFGLVPQARTKLIGIGDSIMAGYGARESWLRTVQKKLPGTVGLYNFATPGIKSSDWLKRIEHVTSVFAKGEHYVVLIDVGGNDMKDAEGRTPDATYADVTAIQKTLRDAAAKTGATIKVGVATVLPNAVTTATFDENRKAFNALVLANKSQFDFTVDFASHAKLGAANANQDKALYIDAIHPTTAGQGMMADQALSIIAKQ